MTLYLNGLESGTPLPFASSVWLGTGNSWNSELLPSWKPIASNCSSVGKHCS